MEGYISIKQVMDDILEHPLLRDLSFERAINYAVNFIRIVGMPKVFTENTVELTIKDYRAVLPCDFIEVIQVMEKCSKRMFRHSTGSFHLSHSLPQQGLTYTIQNSVIITSIKEGTVILSYRGMGVDKDGYPLIVDNTSFIYALEMYIKKERFKILFDTNKITQNVYDRTLQDYAFAVGQAQASLSKLSLDEMQGIANMWTTLIPRMTEHAKGFENEGSMEIIKRH